MKKIAFLTDVHLGEQFPIDNKVNPKVNFERVLSDLSMKQITHIVFGGDIGDAGSHSYFFNALKQFSLHLILGNHDKFSEVKQHFNPSELSEQLCYKVEDLNYKFIFLDTSSDEIDDPQIEWLEKELATDKNLVLFIHHPVIEINTPVDKLYPLKNRERLKSVLLKNNKPVTIFCGHYHLNDEVIYKNLKQITTQSLSFQLVKNADKVVIENKNFGYRIIEMERDKIDTKFISFENHHS
jgi:3',5'-cyclic-AMP phosphodiesterase